ncbi:MAG TPA: c-type cytochrome [Zoogloea sp.]|uniref:c-type cytochrome n=1 Tax=Zoogloea sp. TaxID=49181 RepID=UPI002D0931B1|nr:c-type cytochrome [Zoogloea sp.]HMV17733.1 c-type cytochrome [Rhodocyclaceae bacterium]HMV62192.1 c-type cytochrome [Rhodocyclaceae bacterium]HMW51838.1 c-type cytochrome [Rhodocyclaceae bacterium]HMY49971.1 c-type cytochrome [Rhodocyclaceae bacterium]HMZ76142.1 c-type cytochrome [Rhodocyclaceae bacterium]
MKLLQWSAVLCLAGTAGAALAADRPDPELARNLAATCANCHGTDGRAVPGAGNEALAGVDKAKLLQKLQDFRSGAKPATIMHQIAKGYTDAQLDLIAAYFAARK